MNYKLGDLIVAAKAGEVDVIIHQCNCFVNMGNGIAPLIKQSFPEAWAADCATIQGDTSKLGTFSYGEHSGLIVCNAYGQYGYWRDPANPVNTNYDALTKSLSVIADFLLETKPNCKIGLPKIGCGLGGGDWSIVSEIIEETLGKFDVTVYELSPVDNSSKVN